MLTQGPQKGCGGQTTQQVGRQSLEEAGLGRRMDPATVLCLPLLSVTLAGIMGRTVQSV